MNLSGSSVPVYVKIPGRVASAAEVRDTDRGTLNATARMEQLSIPLEPGWQGGKNAALQVSAASGQGHGATRGVGNDCRAGLEIAGNAGARLPFWRRFR